MFGISVAHTPCYYFDTIPSFINLCEGLDVGLWNGCPPVTASLLNISSRIAEARLGDTATIFGFASGAPRTWKGSIISLLGKTTVGTHLTPNPSEHAQELLFSGAQDRGMSGGAAINGVGMASV